MTANPTGPEVLTSFGSEMEAMVIVEALAEHGIRAQAVGGYTAGFRAEAPGLVKVVVDTNDLAGAREVLAECAREATEIDWSTVDCGDTSPTATEETEESGFDESDVDVEVEKASSSKEGRPFQFSIANLLVLQTVVSVALSIWNGVPGAMLAVIIVVGSMSTLVLAGTVRIGSDLTRSRREIVYLLRIAIVGGLVFLAMLAGLAVLEAIS